MCREYSLNLTIKCKVSVNKKASKVA